MERRLRLDADDAVALYGRALSLDRLADAEKSNSRLEQAIVAYRAVVDLEHGLRDDRLYRLAALRCIDRMRFRGFHNKAVRVQQRLIERFPDEVELRNQMAISHLLLNQPQAARTVLEQVLERWPESGLARVHLGFVLKTAFDDDVNGAVHLAAGIASGDAGVVDGRFYLQLGDALQRLGRPHEAQQVYADGERAGVFLSRQQRSLYNVDRLTGRPWWTAEQTTYDDFLARLGSHWTTIRDEALQALRLGDFDDETEKLRETGRWRQMELFSRGKKNARNCARAPTTCFIVESFPPALCRRGQVKFSVMEAGTHVRAHTGPTNCRLRAHLGLQVPDGGVAQLRVGDVAKSWADGQVLVFDDSFEHEVWHNGTTQRLVLIVDLWHPELTREERRTLDPI